MYFMKHLSESQLLIFNHVQRFVLFLLFEMNTAHVKNFEPLIPDQAWSKRVRGLWEVEI